MEELLCLSARLFKRGIRCAPRDRTIPTARESEVLNLLVKGISVKEIAERLDLSVYTIGAHRTSLHRKLGVHDRAQLVQCAIEKGIVELPSTR